jgi:outer membrane lipoprotein-sorting protein
MRLFTIALAMLAFTTASAQDSKTILDKLSTKAKGYNTITADYSSRLLDEKNGIDISQEGNIVVKGEKYFLDLPDYIVINDGEIIYTYEKASNTCYVDYKEDIEDDTFSPSEMFTIWENDFKHEFKSMEKVDGRENYLINLYPNNPGDKPYHTLQLYVDKAKMEISKVVVKGREGSDITYTVSNFKANPAVEDSKFKFSKASYPGVTVIDNRI